MAGEVKTYINGISAKQVTFESGKSILKLNIHVGKLIEQLQQHVNEKGYVNLGVSDRKEKGKYGETHTVWLDTWKPTPRADAAPVAKADPPPWGEASKTTPEESQELPF
jgi:hypothetical protein